MLAPSPRQPDPAAPAPIGALAVLPVFFKLKGRRVVVAGGSEGAAWKAELLHAAGAAVEVYAAVPCDKMRALVPAITLHETRWTLQALTGAALAVGVRCATDVTGFGLLGHASHIARASNVTLRIDGTALPELTGARLLWKNGVRTGGAERNESFVGPLVDWSRAADADVALALDPQTSGGLLVAVPPDRTEDYLSAVAASVVIGSVERRGNVFIVLG